MIILHDSKRVHRTKIQTCTECAKVIPVMNLYYLIRCIDYDQPSFEVERVRRACPECHDAVLTELRSKYTFYEED